MNSQRFGVTATWQYDAFGSVLASTGTFKGPYGYGGAFGYREDASGLKLLGHRLYDPAAGRFLSRDPIRDGRNWYAYCENDPVNFADLAGLTGVRVTYLYKLYDALGNLVKWGITYNPKGRYTKKKMEEMGAAGMEPITHYKDRAHARTDERVPEEEMPGPWNKVPWSGKGKAAILPLLLAVALGDPMEAGIEFGNAIDPSVKQARRGFNRFGRSRWLDDEDGALLG